jgi:hypothetical protein
MFKPTIHFNDYVSLAVMLLMIVALVSGQVDARAYAAEKVFSATPITGIDDRFNFAIDGHIGDQALKVSIAMVNDLNHFRGEDE